MYARLNALSLHLESLGLTHRSARMHMLHRMAGTEDISALRVLADVVEPVKDYNRWDDAKGPIDFHAPLNGMIDAVYPESDVARRFASLVQTYIQSGFKDHAAEAQIRSQLTTWRDNDVKLHLLLIQSFLLQDVAPISAYLSTVSDAGLRVLDSLDKGEPTPEAWRTAQRIVTAAAQTPKAGLLLMVVAPVQQLVEASANPIPSK
jgi:hexosaminidase